MNVLHVGIFRDHALGGSVILSKGLRYHNCNVEEFDYRQIAAKYGLAEMNSMLLNKTKDKDLVFIYQGELISEHTLQHIKEKGLKTALVYVDFRLPPRKWLIDNLKHVDTFFATFAGDYLKLYHTQGKPKASAFMLVPSDPDLVTKYSFSPRNTRNIVFTGSWYPTMGGERQETIAYLKRRSDVEFWGYHENYNRYINYVKEKLQFIPMRYHPLVRGDQYIQVIKSAKIGVGVSAVQNVPRGTSDRLTHYLAFGTFYMTWTFPEIELLFEPDKQLVCFNNVKELGEKLDYYLEHEEEREKIAEQGQFQMMVNYNYSPMVRMMLDIIETGGSNMYKWVDVIC